MLNYPNYDRDFLEYDQKEPLKEEVSYDFPMLKINNNQDNQTVKLPSPYNTIEEFKTPKKYFGYLTKDSTNENWFKKNLLWIVGSVSILIIIIIIFLIINNKKQSNYYYQ